MVRLARGQREQASLGSDGGWVRSRRARSRLAARSTSDPSETRDSGSELQRDVWVTVRVVLADHAGQSDDPFRWFRFVADDKVSGSHQRIVALYPTERPGLALHVLELAPRPVAGIGHHEPGVSPCSRIEGEGRLFCGQVCVGVENRGGVRLVAAAGQEPGGRPPRRVCLSCAWRSVQDHLTAPLQRLLDFCVDAINSDRLRRESEKPRCCGRASAAPSRPSWSPTPSPGGWSARTSCPNRPRGCAGTQAARATTCSPRR